MTAPETCIVIILFILFVVLAAYGITHGSDEHEKANKICYPFISAQNNLVKTEHGNYAICSDIDGSIQLKELSH